MGLGGTLVLDIQHTNDKLRMCIFLRSATETTVRQYSEINVSFPEINKTCQETALLLNKADNHGIIETHRIRDLKQDCSLLFDLLLTKTIKQRLKEAEGVNLVLSLDESIVHIPWEILFDGENFLCLKFNLGRSMRIKDMPYEPSYKQLSAPLNMLILANPQGNLPFAGREGVAIKDTLDKKRAVIRVDLKTTHIENDYIKKNIRDYDIIHFAGHADYFLDKPQDSGWLFEDGRLRSRDIIKLGEISGLPTLVFAHACETADTGFMGISAEKEVYSLARAFLISGVRHYIATLCKIPDEASIIFAREFYFQMLLDRPVGEAVRLARLGLLKKYGETQISWMSYIVFGDPAFRLFKESRAGFSSAGRKQGLRRHALKIALIFVIIISAFSLTLKVTGNKFTRINALYSEGRNEEAISLCNEILAKEPDNPFVLCVLGDVYERKGQREKALEYYFKYTASSEQKKLKSQSAAGFTKIAWVYYLMGNYPEAFTFYSKTVVLAQEAQDKLAEAVALRKLALWYVDKEDYEKALELLFRSSEINRQKQGDSRHRYNLACDYFDLGLVFTDKDDLKTAQEFYNKSMRLFKELRLSSELSDYYSNMAELSVLNKEYGKAEGFYYNSLAIDKKLNNLPSLAATYAMLGELYWEMTDYPKAEENFYNSLKIHARINDPKGLADVYYSLGLFYKEKGSADNEAFSCLNKAQAFYKNIDTPDYSRIQEEIQQLQQVK